MPHESTVEHTAAEPIPEEVVHMVTLKARNIDDSFAGDGPESNYGSPSHVGRNDSHVPHRRAETPRQITHHHDDDDSDEDGTPEPLEQMEKVINGSCELLVCKTK